ncbi:MAG: right-handed parallel beta-helix repeat-containing protein, partial [Chloroflexi bacterium]|nr:right-handed parallel beta-helix repeat-containing protein [Chloroflexota bacterium]
MPIASFANVVVAHWTRGLLAALVLIALLVAGVPRLTVQGGHGSPIVVNDIGDGADATSGDGVCATAGSVCTLRAAIQTAEASADLDLIIFSSLFDNPQTITLAATSLPDITTNLTISGPGATLLTIDARNIGDSRTLTIDGASGVIQVEIVGLSLTGSTGGALEIKSTNGAPTVRLTDLRIDGNEATGNGGGILSAGADLTIDRSTIANNKALGIDGDGGGIFFADGMLTIDESTISNNMALGKSGDAGGIAFAQGTLTIDGSTLSGNEAGSAGGALEVTGDANVTITRSTFSGNTAGNDGGAICLNGNSDSETTITDSMITDNTSTDGNGGGIWNGEGDLAIKDSTIDRNDTVDGDGGGIFNEEGTLEITDSTIDGNTAEDASDGGGIANFDTLTVTNSTISDNTASDGGGIYSDGAGLGAVTITNSTLSGNTASGRGGAIFDDRSGTDPDQVRFDIRNSTIANNMAQTEGGGLWTQNFIEIETTCNGPIALTAPSLTLISTIVADNTVTSGGTGPDIVKAPDSTVSATNSLIGSDIGNSITEATTNNIVGTSGNLADPLLGLLQNNGGPTQTLALLSGSPAIDMGSNPATTLDFDQRGDPFVREFPTGSPD